MGEIKRYLEQKLIEALFQYLLLLFMGFLGFEAIYTG